MRKQILYIAAMVLAGVLQLESQQTPDRAEIKLAARNDRDSIVLRWGTSSPLAWRTANDSGYHIERATLGPDGTIVDGKFTRLTPSPLKPWTLDEFRSRVTAKHRYAAIAAQMLYGKYNPEEGATSEIGAMRNAANIYSNAHGFALFSADLDQMAAEGLALRFTDRNVRAGESYLYRVLVAGVPTIDSGYADATAEEFTAALPPYGVVAEGIDGQINVTWDPRLSHSSGYNIDRSEDGAQTWKRLNSDPIVPMLRSGGSEIRNAVYSDTNVVNYRRYHYRVTGLTSFGDATAPAVVIASGRDLEAPPSPMLATPDQTGPRTVKLKWSMEKPPMDLAGFVVARGDSSHTPGHPLHTRTLPVTTVCAGTLDPRRT